MNQPQLFVHSNTEKHNQKTILGRRFLDLYDIFILLGILAYTAVLSYLALFRYNTFQLEMDLAIFNQALWNTLTEGSLLVNSIEGGSHLGVHFSPILLTLLPLYAISPEPQTLLIVQSFLLSLGSIPVYLYGRMILGKKTGCLIGLLYLLYPGLHGVNLYDFHEVAFIPFFVGMTLLGYLTGSRKTLLFFAILSILIKEDVALIILMIGLMGLYQSRKEPYASKWDYILLTLISSGLLLAFHLIIRFIFFPEGYGLEAGFIQQYSSPIDNLAQNNDSRFEYFIMMFLPLLFLPLVSPEILAISIPSFLEIFLSPNPLFFSIYNQYSALFIPVIFMATIQSLKKIADSKRFDRTRIYIPVLLALIISSVICSGMYSPASQQISVIQHSDTHLIEKHNTHLNNIVALFPKEASIWTQYNLLPIVSNHKQIGYGYNSDADIILVDKALHKRAIDYDAYQQQLNENFNLTYAKNGLNVYVNKKEPALSLYLSSSFQT